MNKTKWQAMIDNPNQQNFNHYQEKNLHQFLTDKENNIVLRNYYLDPGFVYHIPNVLSKEEVQHINEYQFNYFPVGEDGNAGNYQEEMTVSSYRASCYDAKFAEIIFKRIKGLLPDFILCKKNDYSLDCRFQEYEVLGINPYNRIVSYSKNGKLIPHYDGHYYFDDNIQTMMTCLMYLTDNETGKTQFLKDKQKNIAIKERGIPFQEEEVILEIKPGKGDILFFNQHLLHRTSILENEHKKLILTDLIAAGVLS